MRGFIAKIYISIYVDYMMLEGKISMNKEFYVGFGTLALINAGIAQGKNRSGLNWFLLSLFLGPIATLCLVICDKK